MPKRSKEKKSGGGKGVRTVAGLNRFTASRQSLLFPCGGNKALVTDGSGILSETITSDPSGGSGSSWTCDEWSAMADRYSLCRIVALKVTFTSVMTDDGKTGSAAPAVIGNNLVSQAAPTAYQSVEDNFNYRTWNMAADTSNRGVTHYMFFPKTLPFLPTTAPSAVTGIWGGCPGSIGIYMSGGPTSLRVGTATIVALIEFSGKS